MKEKEPPIIIIAKPQEKIPISTPKELVDMVKERVKSTGHSIISSLATISNEIEIKGETKEKRAENKARICQEAAEGLGINWSDESSEYPKKSFDHTLPKKMPKTIPYNSPESIRFASGLEKRNPLD